VLVAIDEPQTAVYGGEIAAPVFKTIAQQALLYLGVEGDRSEVGEPTVTPLSANEGGKAGRPQLQRIADTPTEDLAGAIPTPVVDGANFLGMSLREAVLTAQRNDWQITTRGSGYVRKQTVTHRSGGPVYNLTLAPTNEGRP
jgi:cell division protein FtsI (penicillin-binding protein 3)